MITRAWKLNRFLAVSVSVVAVLVSAPVPASEFPSLDKLSLFMTHAERDEIDAQEQLPDSLPEIPELVVPEILAKPKPVVNKTTLHGAVIRPDNTAVLFLNTGARVLRDTSEKTLEDFKYTITAYRPPAKIAPGETVKAGINDGK